jgi:hypothetical protein
MELKSAPVETSVARYTAFTSILNLTTLRAQDPGKLLLDRLTNLTKFRSLSLVLQASSQEV